MGVYYTYMLRVGYSILVEDIIELFSKKDQGEFRVEPAITHMEDRFDSKTGAKIDPVCITDSPAKKIWIRKPSHTINIGSEIIDYDNFDPNDLADTLAKQFNCCVEYCGSDENDYHYNFFVHDRGKLDRDEGKISIYNMEMKYSNVVEMKNKIESVGKSMAALGIKVPEPKVFIAESVG